jgi:flagellar hook-basal body complex protein FliE
MAFEAFYSVGRLKPTDLMTDVLGFQNNSGTAGVDGFQEVLAEALENITAERDRITALSLTPASLSGLTGLTEAREASGFDQLKDLASVALSRVNDAQLNAEELAKDYALGENVEVHQVVMAAQEATLAFQLTAAIQNKLVEAYQEIMRMQV